MAGARNAYYVPNPRSVGAWLKSAEVAELCRRAAENGKREAERIAPRDTGDYANGLQVTTQVYGDRQTARLKATARHSPELEVRSRILGRAPDRARPWPPRPRTPTLSGCSSRHWATSATSGRCCRATCTTSCRSCGRVASAAPTTG